MGTQETQFDLFDEAGQPVSPAAAEAKRLTRQQTAILERLRAGPATNMELIPISTRFSARIYDLRQVGYKIDTECIDRAKGLSLYTLKAEPS